MAGNSEELRKIKDNLSKVRVWLLRNDPFLYYLSFVISIDYDSELEEDCVSTKHGICLGKRAPQLKADEFLTALVHGLSHLVYRHPYRHDSMVQTARFFGYDEESAEKLTGLACDEKVYYFLEDEGYAFDQKMAQALKFISDVFKLDTGKDSSEEMLNKMLEKMDGETGDGSPSISSGDSKYVSKNIKQWGSCVRGEKGKTSVSIQKGDIKDEEGLKRELVDTYKRAKNAGTEKANLKNILGIDEENKVDWSALFRSSLVGWIRQFQLQTWHKPNRRLGDDIAGTKIYYKPRVAVGVDTSGSIGDEEFKKFVAEVNAISQVAFVDFYEWDVGRTMKVERFKKTKKIQRTGYGGTEVLPFLNEIISHNPKYDMLIIMSDFELSDDADVVKKALGRFRGRKIGLCAGEEKYEGFDTFINIQ